MVGLAWTTPNSPAVTTVAAMGLRVYLPRSGDQARVFIADDIVRRQLLRDTRWATSRIDQLLSRLTGRSASSSGWMGRCAAVGFPCLGPAVSPNWATETAIETTGGAENTGKRAKIAPPSHCLTCLIKDRYYRKRSFSRPRSRNCVCVYTYLYSLSETRQ